MPELAHRSLHMLLLGSLTAMASAAHTQEQSARAQEQIEELSFFEYLGSMVHDGERWLDPLEAQAIDGLDLTATDPDQMAPIEEAPAPTKGNEVREETQP